MKKISILFALVFLVAITNAQQYRYLTGVLQGSQAGTTSTATGVVMVRYNTVTKLLEHFGNFRGLTGTINNQHIHTGAPGVSGPVTVPLNRTGGANAGGLIGTQILTAQQETDLLAGNMYTNVHSTLYGGGEIRAQLIPTTSGQTEYLSARLQAAQSVPPDSSYGSGDVNVLVDRSTHMLYLTGTYSNLTAAASNAHIHAGAVNTTGDVIVPLIFVAGTSGTLDTVRSIPTATETSILSGNTYVNVHTSTYAAGEIRGQLTQLNQQRFLAGVLQGSQEVPANASPGRGTVIVRYDPVTRQLNLTGDYQNLTSNAVASHIHGPAAPGASADVLFNLTNTGGTMGTLTGTATLTASQETDLLNGLMYVNVHTVNNGGGEIRAQLNPTTAGESQYLTGVLQASQSVTTPNPPVSSSAIGTTTVLLDRVTRQIFVTASYSGLTSGITDSHIHRGVTGTNGPVSIQLQFVAGTTTGTVTGSATITPTLADSITNGISYLNIHTANYRGGEIRAQLGNLVLPVKLVFFNAYKNQNLVTLLWQSAQEQNLKAYVIEEQNVSDQWISKATIPAIGGDKAASYKFNDAPSSTGKSYVLYRLKMVDNDGKFSYSQTLKINYQKSKAELMILNNPVVKGSLQYTITGIGSNERADVSIIDYNGRVVFKTSASSLFNNEINITRLSAGSYKLVVRFKDNVLQKTFIK